MWKSIARLAAVAREITRPIQLAALCVIALLVIGVLLSLHTVSFQNAALLTALTFSITLLGIAYVTPKRDKAHKVSNVPTEAPKQSPPETIPEDLKLKDDLFRRLQGPFHQLGFTLQHAVDSTRWGKTYYYSYAQNRSGRRIALLHLEGSFFLFGPRWMERRWLSFLVQIIKEKPTDLMVFSNTGLVCEEALYEIQDVRRMNKVNTVLMTNLLLATFRSAATSDEDIVEALKLHLKL